VAAGQERARHPDGWAEAGVGNPETFPPLSRPTLSQTFLEGPSRALETALGREQDQSSEILTRPRVALKASLELVPLLRLNASVNHLSTPPITSRFVSLSLLEISVPETE
jgi:hypothetical protein